MIGISFYNAYWFDKAALALWDDRATLTRWLDVEAALAQVQARLGVIPESAAARITQVAKVEAFDLADLADTIAIAQHPLVPVLHRLEALAGEDAGGWLHWGATTQNIFDTAQALQLKATTKLVLGHLEAVCERLTQDARLHHATLQAGRTHGQHALPITYGFKVAGWLAELRRHQARLEALLPHAFVARLGGAVGAYSALQGQGRAVERALAEALDLAAPDIGGRADFDRQTEVMSALAACAACCERIAADLSFLQRTEIAEVAEDHYPDRVGSSTMAQKRNPSEAQRVIALARLTRSRIPLALEAMVRQDEGDAASTNVTDILLPDFGVLAVSTVAALRRLVANIHVDAARMRANLDISGGMISAEAVMMNLGRQIGRGEAHHILHEATATAVETGVDFATAIRTHPSLNGAIEEIDVAAMLDPGRYLGEIKAVIEAVAGPDKTLANGATSP
jgi:adenylosuccinate lyase/3-carboxy-cis,cis-muconate cycloisomerase